MIAKLKGRIDAAGADWLVIDVNGVGYHVACSSQTLSALPGHGEFAEIHTEMLVSQDMIRLVGFATVLRARMVPPAAVGAGGRHQGGAGHSLHPLAAEIGNAIALQDKAMIGRANGVGKKLAERIVLELKDKTPGLRRRRRSAGEACRRPRRAAAHRRGGCRLGARQPRLRPGAGRCGRVRRHAQGGR